MKENETPFGKGFYDYESHLEFFTRQGQQGAEAAFFALALSELIMTEPQWGRAMSMRLKDCVEVLNREAHHLGWNSKHSLGSYMLKYIPLPPDIDMNKPDFLAVAKRDLAEELRKMQGKEVFFAYFLLKEEFLKEYEKFKEQGKVSIEADISRDVLCLLQCNSKKERNDFIKRHQATFLSKLSKK